MRDKIRRLIQAALGLTQEALLRQLNPLLRGWANYYRNGAAQATFGKLDYYVWRKLWRWTSRRHPTKSSAWLKRKYFSAAGDRGVFSVRYRTSSPRVGCSRLTLPGRCHLASVTVTLTQGRNWRFVAVSDAGTSILQDRHLVLDQRLVLPTPTGIRVLAGSERLASTAV